MDDVIKVCQACGNESAHAFGTRGYRKDGAPIFRVASNCRSCNRKKKKAGSPERNTWRHMHDRCYNSSNSYYKNYGGRGIVVCSRWRTFKSFFEDMGPRPDATYSLDRIDTNGNYEPTNCRWATQIEQQNNRNDNCWVTYEGLAMTTAQLARKVGIPQDVLRNRIIRSGWSVEKAVQTPYSPRIFKRDR